MSCVLRISGSPEAIGAVVAKNSFSFLAVRENSVNIDVSDSEIGDLVEQVTAAIFFLHRNSEELHELRHSIGIESACLDFGLSQSGAFAQSFRFPATLLLLAGRCNIDLEITLYPASGEDE
jgi:hypothetical protein